MSKLRLILLTGLLAASVAPLYGCGSECGPGTTEKDGSCVLVAKGCGSGTVLENKQCVVTEDGCGQGTVLQAGTCVPADTICTDGTSFDAASKSCIPNSEIVCGEGTEPNSEGTCVPSADACGPKTTLDANGRCVVDAVVCTAGTQLDPNSGECVISDAACGNGLALDRGTGTCVPTDEVCDTGTSFDSGTGLCLPDACEQGDVLIDGVCMNAAEELAANADVVEQENNDPAMGGTAETLTLPAIGDDPYTFSGTISTPSDLDSDGEADQDVDAFKFTASAGDWVEVMVQSTGLPAPAFVVSGPDGYVRHSAIGTSRDAARGLVIPTDGDYTVEVLPSLVLASDYEVVRGSDKWGYVGSLQAIAAPTPADRDASGGSASLTGELNTLSDNFFSVTNLAATDLVTLEANSIGGDAEAVVQVWADATTLHHTDTIRVGEPVVTGVPSTGDMLVVVDWQSIEGPQVDFDITANVSGVQNTQTLAAGGTYTETVTIEQFDRLVIGQTNPASADLDVSILDPSDTEVAATTLASGGSHEQVAFSAGEYDVVFANNTSSSVDANMQVNVVPPVELGAIGADSTLTSPGVRAGVTDTVYFTMSADAGQVLMIEQDNAHSAAISYEVFDASGATIAQDSGIQPRSATSAFDASDVFWTYLPTDMTVLIAVDPVSAVTGQRLEIESLTPADAGSLSIGGNASLSNSANIPMGRSGFHTVDFTEAMAFSGTLQPGSGEDLDFYLYDLQGTELSAVDGSGGDVPFGGMVDASGTYLVRIECDTACAGYNATMNGVITSEDLGSVSAGTPATSSTVSSFNPGQSLSLTFSAPAGHFIQVTHDNAETSSHALVLYDDNGTELVREGYVAASSSSFAGSLGYYTSAGGTYEVVLEGNNPTTNQSVTVSVSMPTDLGSVALNSPAAASGLGPIASGEWQYYTFTVGSSMDVNIVNTVPNNEDLDLYLYDATMTELDSSASFGPDSLGPLTLSAGTYIVGILGYDAANSYGLEVSTPPPVPASASFSSAPALAIPDSDPTGVSDTLSVSSCATLNSIQVYVDITHTYRGDLLLEVTSPGGTTVAIKQSASDSSNDYIGWFPSEIQADESLSTFAGETGDGQWTLRVEDTVGGDTGTLNEWGVFVDCQ